jgi:hypothetical protein
MKPRDPAPPKKPYERPKLFVYGDLTEMTKSTRRVVGMTDGFGKRRKTG